MARIAPPTRERWRAGLRVLLATAFFVVGVLHLRSTDSFVKIVPDWVPWPRGTVIATGWCEIAGAIALFVPRLRMLAGVMLALYTVCVYPANIKHAVDHIAVGGHALGLWYHVPRLAFQPVIVWWCLFAGGAIDWPWRRVR